MKHTDFYSLTQIIKHQEYAELFIAVEAHGGNYEWVNNSDEERPVIAITPDNSNPNPTDVMISRVYIENTKLKTLGTDKESGEDVKFDPEDVFTGHLANIIDYIPEINGVDDVSINKEIPGTIYVCDECRSTDVEIKEWTLPNKNFEIVSSGCELERDDCWCNNCNDHCKPDIIENPDNKASGTNVRTDIPLSM